jgi:uncharacterized protein YbbC (DUF1343 family)
MRRVAVGLLLAALAILQVGCSTSNGTNTERVLTGAEVLAGENFGEFAGLRIGLITNHTALVDSTHLIDLLDAAPDVELTALFGPEHGLRGNEEAGASVDDAIDDVTGVPVYSLYGSVDRPTPAMLSNVDALVFDIQDVGARFYTYIATMGRSMQAAADEEIPFYVLDRPNPLGGVRVDGFVRDSLHVSGVGPYPIPIQHGMTVGELALMIKGEAYLPGLDDLELHVVRMEGWHRPMLWPDLDREWIPPSPNLPTFDAALVYPGTCLFEGTAASEGRGTMEPFLTLGATWLDARAVAEELNGAGLPGVRFTSETARPESIPGMAVNPKFEGEAMQVLKLHVMRADAYAPVPNGIAILAAVYGHTPPAEKPEFFNSRWLALLAGTTRLEEALRAGKTSTEIALSWQSEVDTFKQKREKYLRYE